MGSSYPGGVMEPRGPWHYDGEIDLGFGGALRMAATVLTRDPIFDWLAYGGMLTVEGNNLRLVPRDGLRRRFYAILSEPKDARSAVRRFKMELDRDGFAAGENIVTDKALNKIAFTLENRTGEEHTTELLLSVPAGSSYSVLQNGEAVKLSWTRNLDYPLRAQLRVTSQPGKVEIVRASR
jgi:hypothetical protein